MTTQNGERIISGHQPNYLPWLGYFYKIHQSNVFVFLDDAQFSNEGMHHYTYIKTRDGAYRLKFPVYQSLGDLIHEVRSKDELGWKEKHLHLLEINYRKAQYFTEVFNDYKDLIYKDYANISELNIAMIKYFVDKLGIKTEFVTSSALNVEGKREEKIIGLCRKLGASIYFSGTGAKAYQKEENFSQYGIALKYSIFTPFQYPQLWEGFQSNVTALDFFMNCGYDWGRVLENQKK